MESINKILLYYGFSPTAKDKNLYISPLTAESTASFHTNYNYNGSVKDWHCFSSGTGGNCVQFIIDYSTINPPLIQDQHKTKKDGTTYVYTAIAQAFKIMNDILGVEQSSYVPPAQPTQEAKKPTGNTLIKSSLVYQYALKNYLLSRGIPESLFSFIHEITYLNNKTGREFFGVGIENVSGGWAYRSKTEFGKGNCGKQDISFIDNGSEVLEVFEGMFDYWSHLALMKRTPNDKSFDYCILNSTNNTTKLLNFIETKKRHKFVNMYADNGSSGDLATIRMQEGVKESIDFSDRRNAFKRFDDVNAFLMNIPNTKDEPRVTKQEGCYNIIYKEKLTPFIGTFKEMEKRFTKYCKAIKAKAKA